MHDALQTQDEFLGVTGLGKDDDIGRLTVFGYQEPVPEWAGQCILKILRPGAQTLDRADRIDRLDLLSESLDCSIFLDCPNPGSRVEKKKFSSTTGFRSTRIATSANNTTVTASIHQCAPDQISLFQTVVLSFIASAPDAYEIGAAQSQAWGLVQHCRLNLNNFHRTFRQCRQKTAAVRLGHYAIVENNDDTAIAFCSDQAADALAKF